MRLRRHPNEQTLHGLLIRNALSYAISSFCHRWPVASSEAPRVITAIKIPLPIHPILTTHFAIEIRAISSADEAWKLGDDGHQIQVGQTTGQNAIGLSPRISNVSGVIMHDR